MGYLEFALSLKAPRNNHDWEQIGTCLNGPHVWRCKKCKEWTRAYKKPDPNAQLIDPDNGDRYRVPELCK